MEEKPIERKPEEAWPSVSLAYDLAIPTYGLTSERLSVVEGRLQSVLGYAATVTLAVPVLASALIKEPNFGSPWFIAGVLMFFVIAAVGIPFLNIGDLRVISPHLLYDKYLHYSEWEFKKNILYFTGQNFDKNAGLVNGKGRVVTLLSVFLLFEILLLVVWIARGIP